MPLSLKACATAAEAAAAMTAERGARYLGGGTLGGGISCPKLSFGGGPPIASIGIGATNSGGLYFSGKAVAPTGYPITSLLGLY